MSDYVTVVTPSGRRRHLARADQPVRLLKTLCGHKALLATGERERPPCSWCDAAVARALTAR